MKLFYFLENVLKPVFEVYLNDYFSDRLNCSTVVKFYSNSGRVIFYNNNSGFLDYELEFFYYENDNKTELYNSFVNKLYFCFKYLDEGFKDISVIKGNKHFVVNGFFRINDFNCLDRWHSFFNLSLLPNYSYSTHNNDFICFIIELLGLFNDFSEYLNSIKLTLRGEEVF